MVTDSGYACRRGFRASARVEICGCERRVELRVELRVDLRVELRVELRGDGVLDSVTPRIRSGLAPIR
jgi:hypothetical protein